MPVNKFNKSSRRLQHRAKNLDEVLLPLTSTSTVFSSRDSRKTQSKSNTISDKHDSSGESCTDLSFLSTIRNRARKPGLVNSSSKSETSLETVTFHLGPIEYVMDYNGQWTISLQTEHSDLKITVDKLTEDNTKLDQENNRLRVENELLAHKIASKTMRKRKLLKELHRLRTLLSTSSSRFSENGAKTK